MSSRERTTAGSERHNRRGMERLVVATKILRSDARSSRGVNFKCKAGYKSWVSPRSLIRNLGKIGLVCTQ